MALILFSEDEVIDYVPEYGGNRQSSEPFVVGLKYVSHSKAQAYGRLIAARAKGIEPGDTAKAAEVSAHVQKKQFCENITYIHGVSIKGQEVTSPEEFYERAPSELIYEIIRAMQSSATLSEGQRKN